MKCIVVDNIILYKTSKGDYFAPSIYNYAFFGRYLKVFDKVKILAKVKVTDDVEGLNKVSGEGLEIIDLPWYRGFRNMLKLFPQLLRIYRNVANDCDCGIYRLAQFESFMVYIFSRKRKNYVYATELVNDPETFVDMASWMRLISVKLTKRIISRAQGSSYVTERFLQDKYPNSFPGHFESYYSSIDLEEKDIVEAPHEYRIGDIFRIVHVSNAINSDIKGHTTLIKAFNLVHMSNNMVELYFVGDGDKVEHYKEMVRNLGLSKNIHFVGRLSSKKTMLDYLSKMDLMVLPTKMEGLPRTIIEAMARGLPCISTPIAGIPELIDSKYLFDPNDYRGIAAEIMHLIESPDELKRMSRTNIEQSHNYCKEILDKRRYEFYSMLKESALVAETH